jgi:hypothetical protein
LVNHARAIGDPVLPTLHNVNGGTHGGFDAVLRRTASGEPDTETPLVPDWPEADFTICNPPFIGKGTIIREALGDAYVEALRKANVRATAARATGEKAGQIHWLHPDYQIPRFAPKGG